MEIASSHYWHHNQYVFLPVLFLRIMLVKTYLVIFSAVFLSSCGVNMPYKYVAATDNDFEKYELQQGEWLLNVHGWLGKRATKIKRYTIVELDFIFKGGFNDINEEDLSMFTTEDDDENDHNYLREIIDNSEVNYFDGKDYFIDLFIHKRKNTHFSSTDLQSTITLTIYDLKNRAQIYWDRIYVGIPEDEPKPSIKWWQHYKSMDYDDLSYKGVKIILNRLK